MANEREREQGADRGRDEGGQRCQLEAGEQRLGEVVVGERAAPVLEREPLPLDVEVADRVVEREQGDDSDRDQHVGGRQPGVDRRPALAQSPGPGRGGRRTGDRLGGVPARACAVLLVAAHRGAAGSPQVDEHHRKDQRHEDERERGRGRVVGQGQELPLDHVADHRLVRSAEEVGVDVVADRGDECQQHAGDDPGCRERQRHPEECGPRGRVQVLRRLDQAPVQPLEAGVDRQHHEREEVVGEPGDHRPVGVQEASVVAQQAEAAKRLDRRALIGEDRLPGERPDQVGGEEGRDHREQQQPLPAPDPEGDRVGKRVGDRQREDGGDGAVGERAPELLSVGRDRVGEVAERPVEDEAVLDRAALERDDAHEEHGHDEEDDEPERARRRQHDGGQPGFHDRSASPVIPWSPAPTPARSRPRPRPRVSAGSSIPR